MILVSEICECCENWLFLSHNMWIKYPMNITLYSDCWEAHSLIGGLPQGLVAFILWTGPILGSSLYLAIVLPLLCFFLFFNLLPIYITHTMTLCNYL